MRAKLPTVPGDVIDVDAGWERRADTGRLGLELLVLLDAGNAVAWRHDRVLGYAVQTPDTWPLGQPMVERYSVVIPRPTPPGTYTLMATLAWARGSATGFAVADDPAVRERSGWVKLGTVTVTCGPLIVRSGSGTQTVPALSAGRTSPEPRPTLPPARASTMRA